MRCVAGVVAVWTLFAAADFFGLKKEDVAVPFLVVGSQVLVGQQAIQAQFPGLIEQGLAPGERIAVSGTFLLDSESRMKLAAAGARGAPAIDPVCGMRVDEAKARAAKRFSEHQGKTYFFCNDGCKEEFDANPKEFVKEAVRQ